MNTTIQICRALIKNKTSSKFQKENFNKVFLAALNKGVYLAPNAYEVGFLSLAHNREILDKAIDILADSLKEI